MARRPGPESDTSRWSFHFAVPTIDANQTQLVLGFDQGGLTSAQARSVVPVLEQATEVVALTVARTFRAGHAPPAAPLRSPQTASDI
jgi:hypothetical protein